MFINNLKNLQIVKYLKKPLKKSGIFIGFLTLIIIFTIISDNFMTPKNIMNVIRQVSFNGIVAIGMSFVISTGGIDLSVGSVLALSALFTTNLCKEGTNIPLFVSILVGLTVALLCGFINGLMVTKGQMAPFIATMATMTMARGGALLFTNGRPITGLTKEFNNIGSGSILFLPIPIFVFLIVTVFAYIMIFRMKIGRKIIAVGGNEKSAISAGIKVNKVKMLVYMASAFLAGLSGIILAGRMNAGSPIVGEGYELDAIAATVIGGTSLSGGVNSVVGTVIGALIIGIISNGLDILNVSSYYQQIVKGIIIVMAILLDTKRSK